MSHDVLSIDELITSLRDPEWCEAPVTDDISPLTVVDLAQAASRAIRSIAVPTTVPRVFAAIRAGLETRSAFDVFIPDTADLDSIASTCADNPHATIALTQLLRMTEPATIVDAVVAESFAYSTLLAGSEFARWLAATPRPTPKPAPETLLLTDDGETVTITIDRPAARNAYDSTTRDAIVNVLRSAVALDGSRRVVLQGSGPSFSSGGDLSEFGTAGDPARAHEIRVARSAGLLLHALGARAQARVHGTCIGAGIELPAFCARIEARADATFRLPELAMGLVPGAGGTASIPRRVGRHRTALLALTARSIDARTALSWGLVDTVADET